MSVANVVLTADTVRIVTDTCAYAGRSPAFFHRKITVRPDAHLAFTVRGPVWVGRGFNELSERWQDFGEAVASAEAVMPTVKDVQPTGSYELTLAGWQDGPRAAKLVYDADRDEVDRFDLAAGVYLAPSLGRFDWPNTITDAQLVEVAKVQQTLTRKHGLNMCVSGDIELTTIDSAGVRVAVLGSYPDKAMTAARMSQAPVDIAERAVA